MVAIKQSKLEDMLTSVVSNLKVSQDEKLFQYSPHSVYTHIDAIAKILQGKNIQVTKKPRDRLVTDSSIYLEKVEVIDSPRFVTYEKRLETLNNYIASIQPRDYSTRDFKQIANAVSSMTSVFETYANASRDKRHEKSEDKIAYKYMNIEMRPSTDEEKTYHSRIAEIRAKHKLQKDQFSAAIKSINEKTQKYVNDPILARERNLDIAMLFEMPNIPEHIRSELYLTQTPVSPKMLKELPPITISPAPSLYSKSISELTDIYTDAKKTVGYGLRTVANGLSSVARGLNRFVFGETNYSPKEATEGVKTFLL